MRRLCAAWAASACLLFARTSKAEPNLDVAWTAPAACSRAGFDRELKRLLADAKLAARPLDAAVELAAREARSYALRLRIANGAARELELSSCAEAQRAAALLIATALNPEHAREDARSDGAPDPAQTTGREQTAPPGEIAPAPGQEDPPEQSAVPQSAPSASSAEPATRRAASWSLRVGAQLALYSVPAASAGPLLGVQRARGRVWTWLEARYLFARGTDDGDSALRAEVDLFTLALAAAWRWQVGDVAVAPLLELEVGALRAVGEGERAARTASAPWAALGAGVRADLPLHGRLQLGMYAQGSVPVWRPGLQLGEESAFYVTAPIGLRTGIVMQLAFTSTSPTRRGQ